MLAQRSSSALALSASRQAARRNLSSQPKMHKVKDHWQNLKSKRPIDQDDLHLWLGFASASETIDTTLDRAKLRSKRQEPLLKQHDIWRRARIRRDVLNMDSAGLPVDEVEDAEIGTSNSMKETGSQKRASKRKPTNDSNQNDPSLTSSASEKRARKSTELFIPANPHDTDRSARIVDGRGQTLQSIPLCKGGGGGKNTTKAAISLTNKEEDDDLPERGTMPDTGQLRKWTKAYICCFNMEKVTIKHALEIAGDKFGVDLSSKKSELKDLLTEEM
ncbi:predicted protein [Phaeodactylum tricornutum CCAP 1055/1]|uniref:DEK-C domain-containing protein n=4 Tax=Phaeodactylum tricornutum TaxID=2850 RepID=B7FX53_PHATC|nr:predicted protein [Phaeodactylum tricornutum CCAP 1055/1]EEC49316.1 predicted protein [Phaeodactylum tricornutum CCAP 1055/1]|eukprot:XP_002179493.1 predicted protein [Phaeodactylum tricornutum CCAP 1055/1]